MKVFVSNKLEKLLQCLAGRLETPLKNPLTAEMIVVQSTGMAKWLMLQLASLHGIAANYRFPFPRNFLEEISSAFLPGYSPDPYFDETVMTWTVFEMLPQLTREDEFHEINRYLGDGNDQNRIYQLARKIASVFDHYLIFRPDMILRWEDGTINDEQEIWQARLWQKMANARGRMHPARLQQLFLSAVKDKPLKPQALPERLSVFGISYLPPFYLEIISRLSDHIPVDYYYLNPSREFWGDIRSGREIGAALSKGSEALSNIDDTLLHMESGNSLLASWGGQGRDFFRLLDEISAEYVDTFEQNEGDSLLCDIQNDIYFLQEADERNPFRGTHTCDDGSIRIHACHSPLREVEILHDNLLAIFEKNSGLAPEDVLVMTPDIEAYAPYIEAVFEAREPKIPYAIADRGQSSGGVVCSGFTAILDLAVGRFTAEEVLSLLENPAIAEKYSVNTSDLEQIRYWVSRTCIKWGIDAAHRQTFDLPPFGQNTWQQGLVRLLAGFALDGRRQEFFETILPCGEIEADQTEVIERFLNFWEHLTGLRKILLEPHPLTEWSKILQQMIADFMSSTEPYRNEKSLLNRMADRLHTESQLANNTCLIELNVIKKYLQDMLAVSGGASRFMAGGVSFCALLPMRNIPFDVICLMGMNHDAYPRQERLSGFNLMETKRRTGDRSQRNDDQYLFLESLLSARRSLIISYIGQSIDDNSVILPSVLVCELLDYLDKNYTDGKGQVLSEMLTIRHPLHGFSPMYFESGKKLFSLSRQNYLAAQAMLDDREAESKFLKDPLPVANYLPKIIPIAELIAFYCNPARAFLENRLGMKLPGKPRSKEEGSEPFEIDTLSAYRIKQALVESHLDGAGGLSVFKLQQAQGVLPVGGAGDYYFSTLSAGAAKFAARLAPYQNERQLENLTIDMPMGDCRLTGILDHLYEENRISCRMAKLKWNDYLGAWIFHLALNVAHLENYPQTTILLGEDGLWRLKPVSHAGEILAKLILYYELGHTRPLKLFPRSSWEFGRVLWQNRKERGEALFAAQNAWQGDGYGWRAAEDRDDAYRICFEGEMPIDQEFEETTTAVLKELFMHLEKPE